MDFNITHMKKIQSALVILGIALIALGCNQQERFLFRKDGTWRTTKETQRVYINGNLSFTDTDIHTTEVYFNKEGTGTLITDGETEATTWSMNDDGDELTICVLEGNSTSTCMTIDVLIAEKDKQVWHTEIQDDDFRIEYDYELRPK